MRCLLPGTNLITWMDHTIFAVTWVRIMTQKICASNVFRDCCVTSNRPSFWQITFNYRQPSPEILFDDASDRAYRNNPWLTRRDRGLLFFGPVVVISPFLLCEPRGSSTTTTSAYATKLISAGFSPLFHVTQRNSPSLSTWLCPFLPALPAAELKITLR